MTKLRDWVEGVVAMGLAIIAMSVSAKVVWDLWDKLIEWLVSQGRSPDIEMWLGVLFFIAAIWLAQSN